MDALLLCVGGLLLAAAATLAAWYRWRSLRRGLAEGLRRAWRVVALRAGLSKVEEAPPDEPAPWLSARARHSGSAPGLAVRFDLRGTPTVPVTRLAVSGLGHAEPGLTLRRRRRGRGEVPGLALAEARLGDASFDEAFEIQGENRLSLLLLDHETRTALAELLGGHLAFATGEARPVVASLEAGRLAVEVAHPRHPRTDAFEAHATDLLAKVLASLLALAERLVPAAEPAERLASNLDTEPEAGVRLAILRHLAGDFPDHPASRAALSAHRGDRSEAVRRLVAEQLGPEDEATLLRLLERRSTPSLRAARAVEALGARLPVELAAATLGRALDRRQKALAKACVERLASVREPRLAELFAQVLEAFPDGKIAAAAARALERLGASGEPPVEGLWLKVLKANPGRRVALIAVRALGRVGTAAAVPALRRLEGRGFVEAARAAIAQIQARLPGAEHGQLSLTGGEAGALSLVTANEPGRLSLAAETSPREDDGN